jgi:hypothetical protein
MADKSTDKIPSLDALPLKGIDDDLRSVQSTRAMLKATMVMVGQILTAPSGLPPMLKLHLNNVKYHITAALSLIDSHLYTGGSTLEPAGKIDGLTEAIDNQIASIRLAKPEWNNWLKTMKPKEAPKPIPKASALDPTAAKKKKSEESALNSEESALSSISKPTSLKTYLIIGGLGLGFYLLWKS